MKVSVIVPAAGQGKRFGGRQNKIFERLKGQPIFLRALQLFANREDVCQILLVVSPEDRSMVAERFGGNLGLLGAHLVDGGPQRSDSVRNALAKVAAEAEFVAVHDAARPCVSPLWIDEVFSAAAESGAAILACPVHGTLKKVLMAEQPAEQLTILGEKIAAAAKRKYRIEKTLERLEGVWEAQTPQVFRKDLLLAAYAKAPAAVATDDAQLVEATGFPVAVVVGDMRNIKITTASDLHLATAIVDTLPKPKPKSDGSPFAEAQW
jgi:2-C-methyl-D-erythritol 4-phosphate cytidylyltransferase